MCILHIQFVVCYTLYCKLCKNVVFLYILYAKIKSKRVCPRELHIIKQQIWCCWLVMLCCWLMLLFWFLLLCCHYFLCISEQPCDNNAQLNFFSINLAIDQYTELTISLYIHLRFLLFKALSRDHCIYLTVQNDSILHYLFRLNFLSIWSIRGPFPSGYVKIYMICRGCGNSNSNYLRWTFFPFFFKYQIEKCGLTETN